MLVICGFDGAGVAKKLEGQLKKFGWKQIFFRVENTFWELANNNQHSGMANFPVLLTFRWTPVTIV